MIAAGGILADLKDFDFKGVKYDIVGQANHGVCSIGPNPWDAFEHIERLEHICEIVLKSGKKPGPEQFCNYTPVVR